MLLQVQVGGNPGVVHTDVAGDHRRSAVCFQLACVQAGLRAQLPGNCTVLLTPQAWAICACPGGLHVGRLRPGMCLCVMRDKLIDLVLTPPGNINVHCL